MAGPSPSQKLGLWALIALVIGSMLDAGIFSLPATFGRATGVLGAIIAWCIAGGGMLMLAFIFQNLATRKPDLDTGPFAYAREGFGNYPGFIAAFGFWAGSCIGSVSYFVLIKSTLSVFFPAFGYGNTPLAIVGSSAGLWIVHFLILRGVHGASAINTMATTAKVMIVVIFVFFVTGAYHADIFDANFWGGYFPAALPVDTIHLDEYGYVGHAAKMMEPGTTGAAESLGLQVRRTMLVAAYVFIGVEGASIYSRYAKRRQDVGIATLIGFLTVLFLFMTVTIISYGVLERSELAALPQPSMAGILNLLGRWRGALFVRVGLIITVLGAFLAWMLLAVEVLFVAAQNGTMPRVLANVNTKGTPTAALWLTSLLVQLFLLLTFFSGYAYGFALEMTSALSRMPYLLAAAYALKLTWTRETYANAPVKRKKDMLIALVAVAYLCIVLWAGGMKSMLSG